MVSDRFLSQFVIFKTSYSSLIIADSLQAYILIFCV